MLEVTVFTHLGVYCKVRDFFQAQGIPTSVSVSLLTRIYMLFHDQTERWNYLKSFILSVTRFPGRNVHISEKKSIMYLKSSRELPSQCCKMLY